MLCARIAVRALSSTAMLSVTASLHGLDHDAKYQNQSAKKNRMHVTILAFVLTYHMIQNMVISAVAWQVHMAGAVNETRIIVKTNYLTGNIAMVTVNVTMESDVKI